MSFLVLAGINILRYADPPQWPATEATPAPDPALTGLTNFQHFQSPAHWGIAYQIGGVPYAIVAGSASRRSGQPYSIAINLRTLTTVGFGPFPGTADPRGRTFDTYPFVAVPGQPLNTAVGVSQFSGIVNNGDDMRRYVGGAVMGNAAPDFAGLTDPATKTSLSLLGQFGQFVFLRGSQAGGIYVRNINGDDISSSFKNRLPPDRLPAAPGGPTLFQVNQVTHMVHDGAFAYLLIQGRMYRYSWPLVSVG